jgi:hypothetical protein
MAFEALYSAADLSQHCLLPERVADRCRSRGRGNASGWGLGWRGVLLVLTRRRGNAKEQVWGSAGSCPNVDVVLAMARVGPSGTQQMRRFLEHGATWAVTLGRMRFRAHARQARRPAAFRNPEIASRHGGRDGHGSSLACLPRFAPWNSVEANTINSRASTISRSW